MISWPAIVPTVELDIPDAIREIKNTPAAPTPSNGVNVPRDDDQVTHCSKDAFNGRHGKAAL